MDLVMCPNGHPNRPGRSQCVVCKAPLPLLATAEGSVPVEPAAPSAQSAPAPSTVAQASTPPPKAGPPPATKEPDAKTTTDAPKRGCGRYIILLVIGLIAVAVIVGAIFWPMLKYNDKTTLLVATAVMSDVTVPAEETVAIAIEPVEPTAAPQPTAVPPTETAPRPTDAPAEPTAEPAQPTTAPTTAAGDDTQPLDHGNLITNGDFSARWVDTWTRQVSNNNGVQAVEAVTFENAPSASGLRLTKSGTGTTLVQQTIDVPRRATELRFTGNLRLAGSLAADGVSEGRVALMLTYLDENSQPLGYSVWIDDSQPASGLWGISPLPEFGPRLSPHFADGEAWQTIDVRLQEEFINRLPGLDAGQVKHIGISLLALASDTCTPEDCPVTLEVSDLQFVPTAME